ncbi:MAG: hypothetical protein R3B56_09975 [Candidatus Scalinduaceae bacterium]
MKIMNLQLLKKYISSGCCIWLLFSLFTGCVYEHPGSATGTGAGVGAGAGALTGALAGNKIEGISTAEGAIAGALIGGLLGGVMGNQKDAMKQQNASVNRRLDAVDRDANSTVVNITNTNGSTTPVYLHRSGNQWVGPRGEAYNDIPTHEQLRPVYGF